MKKPKLTKPQLEEALDVLRKAPKYDKAVMRRNHRIKIVAVLLDAAQRDAIGIARVELNKLDVGILARMHEGTTGFNIFVRQGSDVPLSHLVSWLRLREAEARHLKFSSTVNDLLAYPGKPMIGDKTTPWAVDYAERTITSATYKGTPTKLAFLEVCEAIHYAINVNLPPTVKEKPAVATPTLAPMTTAPQPTA